MLVHAVVVPGAPVLVPEVAAGAADDLADLRAQALAALSELAATPHDALVLVGPGPMTHAWPAASPASFAGLGLAGPPPSGSLPVALGVGRTLLDAAGASPTLVQTVAADATVEQCRDLGAALADAAPRVAAVVVGDGSACRSAKAPGALDDRAVGFDERWLTALASGDGDGLLAIDPQEAAEVLAAGRPAWQVLAGMAQGVDIVAGDLATADPFGVQYAVAAWRAAA